MQVYLHNNENNYCCLDSIKGWLEYYLQKQNDYNYLKGKVSDIGIKTILARFNTLAYLKSAYAIGQIYFPSKRKVVNTSSISLTHKNSLEEICLYNTKSEKQRKGLFLDYLKHKNLVERIEIIDSKTRSFLIDNGINIDHLGNELIYSKPLSYWEYYLLKDIPTFITLTKESENDKLYKLPWEKAHIIYSLLRCTYIGEKRKLESIDLQNSREEFEAKVQRDTGLLLKKYIMTQVRKVIDPTIRKVLKKR